MSNHILGKTACRQFELELASYFEGEAMPAVHIHAQECPSCSVILADIEAIRLASREIPLEDPPARVWANIRATLAQDGALREPIARRERWFRYLGFLPDPAPVAALASLAILGVFLLVHSRRFENNLTSSPSGPVAEAASASDYVSDDAKLTHTLEDMEKSYWAREKSLDPSVTVIYRKSLRSLDNSIDECRDSVRRQPANDLAQQYLLTAYAQKAEVLASALEFGNR